MKMTQRRNAYKKDVINQELEALLKQVEELKEEGKTEQVQELINQYLKNFKKTYEMLMWNKEKEDRDLSSYKFPGRGTVVATNDVVQLRVISETERENYRNICKEYWSMEKTNSDIDEEKMYIDTFFSKKTFVTSIYDSLNDDFLGYCSIKDLREKVWEISIELDPHYKAIIDVDNYASQKAFKKVGAYPDGISEFILTGDHLINFQKENQDLIDDNLRQVAKEFCMEPEDIIGYVLVYKIDMEKQN